MQQLVEGSEEQRVGATVKAHLRKIRWEFVIPIMLCLVVSL